MDARDKVTSYVHENISPMLRAGEPRFDEERGHWHVPVVCDAGDRASALGTFVLDRRLRFIRNPAKQVMDRLTDHLSSTGKGQDGTKDEAPAGSEEALGDAVATPRPLTEHAEEISLVDQLTGLGTAASFLLRLDQEIDRATRYNSQFCLAFVDIEGVWPVNLEHGPLVADALIAQAAKVIERLVRGGDFVAHWAGARFALLLQGPKDEVLVGTDRILIGIRAFAPVVRAGEQPLTISANMGGTSIPPADPDSEFAAPALIKEARGMLMAAKASDSDDPVFS